MKKIFGILFIIFMFVMIFYIYSTYIFIKPSDYDKKIYSVLLINNTGNKVENITVSYRHSPNDVPVICENISELSINEEKKINIFTDIEPYGSYNVSIDIGTEDIQHEDIGYFGTNAGGFVAVELNNSYGQVRISRIYENTFKYKKLYRKHLKNQLSV